MTIPSLPHADSLALLGAFLTGAGVSRLLARGPRPWGLALCALASGSLLLARPLGLRRLAAVALGLALLAALAALVAWRGPKGAFGRARALGELVLALLIAAWSGTAVLRPLRPPATPQAVEKAGTADPWEFRKYNFKFAPPPSPWVALDAHKVGDGGLVYLMRTDLPISLSVRASLEDGDDPSKIEAVAELAKGRLQSAAGKSFRLFEEGPFELQGLPGLRLVAESDEGSGLENRVVWVYGHAGFLYELAAWADAARVPRETLVAESQAAMGGFEMLDRERVAVAVETDTKGFHSVLYGYDVAPAGKGWAEWADVSRDVPGAEYGLLSDDDASLAILPVPLLGHDPDLPILSRSLLEQLDIDFPGPGMGACHEVSEGGLSGCDYDYEGSPGGVASVYRLRILKGRGVAFLLASSIPKRVAAAKGHELEDVVRLVRFSPLPRPLSLDRLPPDDRSPKGRIFNEMGLAYYEKEQYEDALSSFRLAFELNPLDSVLLENTVEAYSALGRYREGLEFLDRRIQSFPHASELQEWREYLKEQVDQDRDQSPANKSA
jgi:tetratricopeptide (TPR) repeat protein